MFPEMESDNRRVAIYIRVSTDEQKREGHSLDAQEKRLKEYVELNPGLKLITKNEWLYSDTHTGSDLNRPELKRLIEDVKEKKFDAVLVWKIDRFSRSLKHLLHLFEELEKNGVSFISIQENIDFKGPIGRLIFQIFGAIAQFERELIKQRTTMGRIASAEAGNFTGTYIPYGFLPKIEKGKKGKRLEIDKDEAKWIQQIYKWYIYEGHGDNKIAKLLNDEQVKRSHWEKTEDSWNKTYAGAKWTHKMITNILTNPLYRGQFIANTKDEEGNELSPDKHTITQIPPIVSELMFMQAEFAREDRMSGRAAETDYLLSGKLRDFSLDTPKGFVGAPRYKGGSSYRRKQFEDKVTGEKYSVFEVPAQPLEDFVWKKIMEALDNPKVFIQHYLSRQFSDPTRLSRIEERLSHIRSELVNLDLKVAKIEYAYENGSYSEEKMTSKLSDVSSQRMKLEEKEQELEDEIRLLSAVDAEVEKLKDASEAVKHQLGKLDRKQKKILCNLFVDRVEMQRSRTTTDDGRQKWKVSANVIFRFNPKKFHMENKGVANSNMKCITQKSS